MLQPTKTLEKLRRPIWRPYTQEAIAPLPLVIERANGAHLYEKSGRKIFDGISSWWVITHGHCHPLVVEAIQKQAEKTDQIIFANFSHSPAEELAEELIRRTPENLTRVFFTDNGSTAVESALKMALQACLQRGFTDKNKFIAFSKAYHGDTVGAMSVSGQSLFTRPYKSTLFDILRVEQPDDLADPNFIKYFSEIIETNHDQIAGLIIEPLIQGAAGMIFWPKETLKQVVEFCKKKNILIIFDEVMTGFGRTGSLFAFEQIGVVPDLICLSKGLTGGSLPLAVTLASEDIYQAFYSEEKTKMFFHGHSFTGNPISCAAACATLKVFDLENSLENIRKIKEINSKSLKKISQSFSISNPRICGVVAAFEIKVEKEGYSSQISERITQEALKSDVFVRPLGNTVYLLPPYCSTSDDLDCAWEVIQNAIAKSVSF